MAIGARTSNAICPEHVNFMQTWFSSSNGALTLTMLITIGIGLALLSAITTQGLTARTLAARLLILGFAIFLVGGVLFTGRAFLKWQIAETASYLLWERGFVIAGV